MRCEHCNGTGTVAALARPSEGDCFEVKLSCWTCDGAGTVTQAKLDAIERGRVLRRARIDRGQTVREVASEYGMTASQLSALEHGRACCEAYKERGACSHSTVFG